MPRELSAEVQAVVISQRFTYYDHAEIHLPFGPDDVVPRILYVSTGLIEVLSSLDFNEFTDVAFKGVFDRPPTSAERTDWVDALETALAINFAALLAEAKDRIDDLFTSAEYTARMRNDDQFVGDLYLAFLGRVAEAGGKAFWVAEVIATSRNAVRSSFGGSDEFIDRITRMSVPSASDSDVRDMGDLSFADGAATDGVEFSLSNLESYFSDLLVQPGRRLYPAPSVTFRAFQLTDGTFQSVEMLTGFARFNSVDGDNARVSIFSDMSRRGIDVVELDTQRCRAVYKGPRCDSPDASPTCSRLFDDATNGCPSKDPAPQLTTPVPANNLPSFVGTPALRPVAPTGQGLPAPETGGVNPGGWPPDIDPYDPRLRNHYHGVMPL